MNWSQEKTIEFIEEYRKVVALWDIRLVEYKNNQAKLHAQRGLAKKFDCDVAEVKKKIKNLRTAFHREHRKLTQKKSGSSKKRTKWFAYDLLLFLLEVEKPRLGYSSEVEAQAEQPISDEDEPGSDLDAETLGTFLTLKSEVAEASQEVEKGGKNDDGKRASNKKTRQNWKRKTIEDERAEEAYNILKESVKRDDCTIYGEHVASEIRKLYPRAQTIVKHLINNILFEAAMGEYDSAGQSPRFGLPTPQPFDISAASTHHNASASDSSTYDGSDSSTCNASYSASSTPHDYEHGAST